jgi:hypothetical protein
VLCCSVWCVLRRVCSVQTVHKYCCSFFGFQLLCVLINVLGALPLGLGLFITIPWTLSAQCYMYHAIFGINGMAILTTPTVVPAAAPAPAPVAPVAAAPAPVTVVVARA